MGGGKITSRLPKASIGCEGLITRGPLRGEPRQGTVAGYNRHRFYGELACEECLEAVRRHQLRPEVRIRKSQWVVQNPEKRIASLRSYYLSHVESERVRKQNWGKLNPERQREWSRRRRARQANNLVIEFTDEQLAQRMTYWGNRCWMCLGSFDEVDHVIPISLGGPHCLSNLRPACTECNRKKHAKRVA